jgi:hypothetical protein
MSERLPRTPFVLLGLMTVLTVGGPIAILQSIKGGTSPRWPPDRAVEWWTFGLITAGVVVLMAACLGIGLLNWRKTLAKQRKAVAAMPSQAPTAPVDESFNPD